MNLIYVFANTHASWAHDITMWNEIQHLILHSKQWHHPGIIIHIFTLTRFSFIVKTLKHEVKHSTTFCKWNDADETRATESISCTNIYPFYKKLEGIGVKQHPLNNPKIFIDRWNKGKRWTIYKKCREYKF